MIKRIVLAGHAASGKDHARKSLEELGLTYGISYTSRMPREGEVNGVDYNFLTRNQFQRQSHANFWYEYVEFNGWYYGTSNEQFLGGNEIFIMTPHGISLIKPEDRKETLVIFFNVPEDIREDRLQDRGDTADSNERRMKADSNDFSQYTDWDVQISDPNFNLKELIDHESFKAIEFNDYIYTTLYQPNALNI